MANNLPNKELVNILIEAYKPCENFGICKDAKWNPEEGDIPRGFLGAIGSIEDIEAIFIIAEPSTPQETYSTNISNIDHMKEAVDDAYMRYSSMTSLGHKNLNRIMERIWPEIEFNDHLKKVWITESRLCSVSSPLASTSVSDRMLCAEKYLLKQLELFDLDKVKIVCFGGKSHETMDRLGVNYLKAGAIYPPGCNFPKTKKSWDNVINEIKNKSDLISR